MTATEFRQWLEKRGCTFLPGRGGHLLVRYGIRMASLPMHEPDGRLPKGNAKGIRKHLGLK